MKKRQALQTAQRNVRLGKAICVAVAVLLVGGVANFAAFGIIRFEYDFTSETGRVLSQDPIPEGITFSGLTLNNVVKLGPSPIPGIGGTLFGPWDPPIDHYISFTIFAPSGYQLHVTSYDAFVTIGATAQLELSGPGTSEEVKMRIFKGAGIRDPRPLSTLRGELSLISTYMLEVGSGSGDGAYATGTMVTVIADPPPTGQHFAGWSGDIAILSNPFLATTTAIVPSMNVKIFAMYSELPTYTVTVTNGSGDGNYLAGAQVAISADAAPPGQQFAGWTGEVTFGDASSPTTTFTMPSSAVEVTATYSDSTGTGTGLRGQYYNDSSNASYPPANPFAGSPILTGTDATVDFSWAGGSPGSPVTSNFFSAKWTGQVKAPVTGTYTFTVTGDDGVRLFLNGVKVIDGWRDQGATPYTYTTTLTAGTLYSIELHYYEHEGDAACRLQWSYPGQTTQAIPQSQLYPTMEETPGTGLRGQYYNDGSNTTYPPANPFAGSPVLTRTDATVDFTWDTSSPGSPVTSNFFSAKWTGQVKAPVTGSYTFTVTGDDGVRLFLNGVKAIDAWKDQGATPYSYTTALTAGTLYNIELHYYEHEGDAACRLQWSYPGQTTQAIPQSQLYPTVEATPGAGLRGQYYNDNSSTPYPLANPFGVSPVLTRTDATVDFNWGGNSPGSPVTSNFFSAKWTGQVKAPVTETYTFTVTGDDGVRLFLNGAKVIDAWRDQGATPYSYTTTLTAGALYDIELHYYEHEGNAACSLQWSYPGKATQAIPQSQLYSNESTQGHELDQENVPIGGSGGLEITRNQTVAQSFSISKPGKLSRVDVIDIRHHRCPPKESLYISLIDMSGDQLGQNTYYTREVYPHEVNGTISLEFGNYAPTVSKGDKYAIYLKTDAEPSGCTYAWGGGIETYDGGDTFINERKNIRDMKFRSYVTDK